MIPTFKYQDVDGNPVSSPSHPAWMFTVIGDCVRIVKNGRPEELKDGAWKPIDPAVAVAVESRDSTPSEPSVATASTEPPPPPEPKKRKK